MAITSRMKEARIRKGLTQERLAKEIGVAKSTYTGYEKGNSEPNMLILSRIMNVLDIDANFLFQDEMEDLRDSNATPEEMEHIVKKYRSLDQYGKEAVDGVLDVEHRRCEEDRKAREAKAKILHDEKTEMEVSEEIACFILPCYLHPSSAGTGEYSSGDEWEELTMTKRPPRGTSYVVRVHGESMEPTFHDGDKVFVRAGAEVMPGQIGIFVMDGDQYIKELGEGFLISHNPAYEPLRIKDDTRCQGLVLGVCDESYFE